MDLYLLKVNEKVLLLGEGNFSFSVSLIEFNEKPKLNFINFYSTCFETDITCPDTLENISKIKSHGFNVIQGVDATKLSENPVIGSIKFDKIIFNFPHIGGKMKINLNRDLIKEFFISSTQVLADGGVVAVALCAGQGGTTFEKTPRKYENTWQVVEMAGHGDFILSEVHPFPNEKFPTYVSSGFRGKSKSFNTTDALVHIFSRGIPPLESIDKPTLSNLMGYSNLPNQTNVKVPYVYSKILTRNPLENETPQNFLKNIVITIAEQFSQPISSGDLPLIISKDDPSHVKCQINGKDHYLRQSLDEVLPHYLFPENTYIFSGIVFQQLSSDFSVSPVKCECIIIGKSAQDVCQSYITKVKELFPQMDSIWVFREHDSIMIWSNMIKHKKQLLKLGKITIEGKEMRICYVDLDALSSYVFSIESWKELWWPKIQFNLKPDYSVTLPHHCSQTYSFDINFTTSSTFDMTNFINLLWQVGDNMICAVLPMNTYKHAENGNLSNCYRIVYKSFERPLFRKRVVNFHENVIGKSLQILYNVVIS